ncbi:MAG: phosphate acyltransferase, partial [Candidatus Cloacimonadaceae bacterium]|nr:phosphate acyltransferase [Candidatus Cloacimonadaceae bacterium]
MNQITSLSQLAGYVKDRGTRTRIAVAVAEDQNTLGAIARAVDEGFVHAILLGNKDNIHQVCARECIDPAPFEIIHIPDEVAAVKEAVRMVRADEA